MASLVAAATGLIAATLAHASDPPVDFNREIRPVLAHRCLLCHGFDHSTRKAGLRLDLREEATAPRSDGKPAIVPGDRNASALWGKITRTDGDRMPPVEREALTPGEIDLLGRWIDAGAPYAQPWAWQPVRDPVPPAVADEHWPRAPLDRFILARLEREKLHPAPESSRTEWLRRVTFDLTGLPPAPEQLSAFRADDTPGAYERVVDRLLSSSHYGERWGRHWLDLVRYAETHGHEFDYPIEGAWEYRDYVVRAWNADVPFDAFVREHIAGDLIDPPRVHPERGTNESILGTGFWYLSQGTHGPVDVRQDQADRTDNQIDVLAKTFLGITVSCARCHDHKFDPILTADYYALAGFLRSSRRAIVHLDPNGEIAAGVARIEGAQARLAPVLASRVEVARHRPWAEAARVGVALIAETRGKNEELRRPEIVLFDFEGGTWDPWTVEGDAFGPSPLRSGDFVLEQGIGVHGEGVANSHDRRLGTDGGASDRRTGTLTSPEFTIELPRLLFAIGGGDHPKETCVNLQVDGEPVRTITGGNSTQMHEVEWDLADLVGSRARLQLIDTHTGGWGHIAADHFRLVDAEASQIPGDDTIARVGREVSLTAAEFRPLLEALSRFHSRPIESDLPRRERLVFADFESPDAFSGWFPEGVAFGSGPVARGAILAVPEGLRAVDAGSADSARFGRRAQGTLRSPSFIIEHDYIQVRARGVGTQIRVIIDDYYLDTANALLFEAMSQTVDQERWHYRRHDVGRYRGHRAYLEWNDDGDGYLAVDEVWFSDVPDGPGGLEFEPVLDEQDPEEWLADPFRLRWLLEEGVPILGFFGEDATEFEQIRAAAQEMPNPVRALALVEGTPADEHVFIRGGHRTLGEVAPRRLVSTLLPDQARIERGSGRMKLADRILDLRTPLPHRVMVNRVWQHLLGRGIVETPDDFGALGRVPTHPDLLDHLAMLLRRDPSLKQLIRGIVLSATYRQSARSDDPCAAEIDPENRLLHRRPPRRLDAEEVRDAVLAVSGRLDRTIGGPPVEVHLTDFLTGRGRPGQSGPRDGAGRRSIYTAVRRNFLPQFLLAFDASIPFSTVGRRSVSNVPAQGLARMNDPFVHEQAMLWADRILAANLPDHAARVDRMVLEAYGRPAATEERALLLEFLGTEPDRESWKDLAHALFASQEFIFLE